MDYACHLCDWNTDEARALVEHLGRHAGIHRERDRRCEVCFRFMAATGFPICAECRQLGDREYRRRS